MRDRDDRPDDEDLALFFQAMEGVRPLADRQQADRQLTDRQLTDRQQADRQQGAAGARLAAALSVGQHGANRRPSKRRPSQVAGVRRRIVVETVGEEVRGLAVGVDQALLGRLRDEGRYDHRLDLHRLDREAARELIERRLWHAYMTAQRRILVVHGRGLRSASGPVLKTWLPDFLASPPLDRLVLAFTTAAPPQGGPGAMLVLLRKQRRRKS